MNDLLSVVYFGNTIGTYITAIVVFLISIAVIHIFKKIVLNKLEKWSKKTENHD